MPKPIIVHCPICGKCTDAYCTVPAGIVLECEHCALAYVVDPDLNLIRKRIVGVA